MARVRSNPTIAAGHELNRIRIFCGSSAETLFSRVGADAENVIAIWLQAGQFGPMNPLIGDRKTTCRVRVIVPLLAALFGIPDRPLGALRLGTDPLDRHCGRGVALPGEKERPGFECRHVGKLWYFARRIAKNEM
jgi:hypothetical protein